MAERISFDRIADVYDETRSLPPKVLAKAAGVLAEALQGKRVLEIGVGTGRVAVPLQKSGIEVVGIDISTQMVARGLEKGLRNVVFADAAHLPFRDGTFDAATSNHVLHLLPDWRRALREVERVLRVRGIYFSLIDRDREEISLSDEYHRIARSLGYARPEPGVRERDLANHVPPTKVKEIARHEESILADGVLDKLERRIYAFMWNVPDAVHLQTIRTLRKDHGGRTLNRKVDFEIAYWTRPLVGKLANVRPKDPSGPPRA